MKKLFAVLTMVMALFFALEVPVMAQTGDWVRVDSVLNNNPSYTWAPHAWADAVRSGQIELTVFQNGKEFKTWGYSIEHAGYNLFGKNYSCQISELDSQTEIQAQWIHYYHSTRDMTDLANSRELQAKILGWRYYDKDGVVVPPWSIPFPIPVGVSPVTYNNLSDLYAVATVPTLNNREGGDFIFRKVPQVIEAIINVIPKKMNIVAGKVPVVVFSSETFDAGSIDISSLTFGATGNEQSLSHCDYGQDVDLDGRADLVCHFNKDLMGFNPGIGETTAYLQGKMLDGTLLEGYDVVWIMK